MEAKSALPPGKPREGLFLALVVWLIAGVAVALGAKPWLPPLASEHGAGIDLMLNYLLITVGSLLVVGHAVLGYFLWRFSRKGHVTYRVASPQLERRWSLIPVVLMSLVAEGGVFALGMPVWKKFYAAPSPADAVVVEVTGEQFAWNVRYPGQDGKFGHTDPRLITLDNPLGLDRNDPAAQDDIVLLGKLTLPVNKPTRIRLRSKDVIHSFFLPNLRVKQDAVPGMTIDFWFVPTQVGMYEVACAQLCGYGHFQMRGILQVVPPEDFEKWVKEQLPFF